MSKRKSEPEEPEQEPRWQQRLMPDDFCEWWHPTGTDALSGASIGGHPHSERVWARKDPGRWSRTTSGLTAIQAWLSDTYRQEYYNWVAAGRPEREPPFESSCIPYDECADRMRTVEKQVGEAVQPMPKVSPKEMQAEARRMSLPARRIEPIDEPQQPTKEEIDNDEPEPIEF